MNYCEHITTRGYWCKSKATKTVGTKTYCARHADHPDAGKSYPPVSRKYKRR